MTLVPNVTETVVSLPLHGDWSLADPGQMRVIKRDGHEVSYDPDKIFQAVSRCMVSVNRPEAIVLTLATQVMDQVDHILRIKARKADGGLDPINIEVIQNIVEIQLMALGHHDAAKHYILYRDDRRRLREVNRVSPELQEKFREGCSYFSSGNTLIRQAQYFDKFSRYDWNRGRREYWLETVDRTMGYFQGHMQQFAPDAVTEDEWRDLKKGLIEQEATPSLRSIQMAGPALERCQTGCFNCSYLEMDSPDSLAEDLYLLMSGVGVGFSVEEDIVDRWPRIKSQRGGDPISYTIEDNTESWCDGLKFGLYTWIDGGDVDFDLSLVRPKGSILRTKGGRSSGPGPLRDLLSFARSMILRRQGKRLRTIDVHDLTCMTHRVGQMGGVRRASGLSISSLDDILMRHAKDGTFYNEHPYRNQANDTTAYDVKPTAVEFMEEWLSLAKSGSGERGILNRGGIPFQIPKRRQVRRFGVNPCLVGETPVWVADGRCAVSIQQLAAEGKDVPVFCMDRDFKLTIRQMRNPRITGYQEPVLKVTLDDQCAIRATRKHRFLLKNGSYCEAQDLKPGMSLKLVTRYTPEKTDPKSQSRSDRYIFSGCGGDSYYEHVMIAEFHQGRNVGAGDHVHHKNEDRMDNSPGNLKIQVGTDHLATHSGEESNSNFSGVSNEELVSIGRSLVRSLGRRFSTTEWVDFAGSQGLPQNFSSWRERSLGTIAAFSRHCSLLEGADEFVDIDPRVIRTYKKMVLAGLDAEIVSGKVFIRKKCENCGNEFTRDHRQREVTYCSIRCSKASSPESPETREKRLKTQALTLDNRRKELRSRQLDVYSSLRNRLGRSPQKKEWVEECRSQGVSTEICRQSSPFISWKALEQAGIDVNHRVVSVEEDGYADVYNGTVDDFHNFCVGGWDGGLTAKGRRRQWWCINAQCGEIFLRSRSFCNLSIAVSRVEDSLETLLRKTRLATFWGKMQASMTHFRYIRDEWRQNTIDESLLGVDILGHMDCDLLRPDAPHDRAPLLQILRQDVVDNDLTLSRRFGMNQSAATTCGKPSGDSSVWFDKPAGHKAHQGRFYLRRMRFSQMNPVAKVLQEAGVPWEHEYDKAGNVVFEFPCQSPPGTLVLGDQSAIDQLENWKTWKVNFTEHNPSATITIKEHEWIAAGNWVYENWDIVGGLSFLPYDGGVYPQAPYQTITEEEYNQRMASMPAEIDWSRITLYEQSDMTELAGAFACTGRGCDS